MKPARVLVLGVSGAGKTTMARNLSDRLGLPFSSTDDIYWRRGWIPVPGDEVIDGVLGAAAEGRWIIDGNFDDQRHRLWPLADLIVWLDLPKRTVLRRVAVRNMAWFFGRRSVWAGNRMTLAKALSGIRHAARSYDRKRRDYPIWLGEVDARVVRLRSPGAVANWLQSLRGLSETRGSKEGP